MSYPMLFLNLLITPHLIETYLNLCVMVNDEMMNRMNIQTSNIKLKFLVFSDAFFKS